MSSGNMAPWNPEHLLTRATGFRDRVRMRVENGLDKEATLSIVIDCVSATRELAKAWLPLQCDEQRIYLKYGLIDILLDVAPVVEAKAPLRKEIIDQGFAWLQYGERFNYDELRKGSLLYYWLLRADPTVVKSYYQSRFDFDSSSKPLYSDAELDAFYDENVQLVHQTMMREVYPDNGVFYEDPLSQRSASMYYDYCEKLLAIGYVEREIPNVDDLRMK